MSKNEYSVLKFGNGVYDPNVVNALTLTKSFQIMRVPKSSAEEVKVQFIEPAFRGKSGLVVFHQPWCPHCQNLAPTVMKLANITKGLFPVGVIDCSDETNGNNLLADYFDVAGYPTIKFYDKGEFTDYSGGRNLTDFLKFLCKAKGICDLEVSDYIGALGMKLGSKLD